MRGKEMKNLKKIATLSKNATGWRPLMLYFNFDTNELLTDGMFNLKDIDELKVFPLNTGLIRKCSEQEIIDTVNWALGL